MPDSSSDLARIAKRLPELLQKLKTAAKKSATAEQHREAFQMGCELFTALVDSLEKSDPTLGALEAALGYRISVKDIEGLIDAESKVLRRMNLSEEDTRKAAELLRSLGNQGELRDLEASASRTLDALGSLRSALCELASLTEGNWKISAETVDLVSDSVLDSCLITGDLLAVPVGIAAGPLGVTAAVFLAVASVGSGVKSIFKRIDTLRQRVRDEKDQKEQHERAARDQKALREKPAPKIDTPKTDKKT